MRKLLTTALLAATMFGSVTPALAVTSAQAAEHNALVATLQRHGVSVELDASICHQKPIQGFYHSPSKTLVLCNGGSTQMTDENLDTLRHEAIHFAQDCRDGTKGNHALHHVLKEGVAKELAAEVGLDLSEIRRVYLSHGVDEYTIGLEYEAFTAAAAMPAGTIAQAIDVFCGAAQ